MSDCGWWVGAALMVAVSASLACDPWAEAPTFSPSPVVQWDEAARVEFYRVWWRVEGDTTWNLLVDVPCRPACVSWDTENECIETDPHGFCPGEDIGLPLQRYDGLLAAFTRYEFSVSAANAYGESPDKSNTVTICWYPECPVDDVHPFGDPPSCCDPSGPQSWCE